MIVKENTGVFFFRSDLDLDQQDKFCISAHPCIMSHHTFEI